MRISTFSKSRLNYNAHYEVMTAFHRLVAPLTDRYALLQQPVQAFAEALEAEKKSFGIVLKSRYTALIKKCFEERNALHGMLRHTVRVLSRCTSGSERAAALRVGSIIKRYKFNTRTQYDESIGIVASELKAFDPLDIATLDMTPRVRQMQKANDLMRRYIAERNEERSHKERAAMKNAVKAVNRTYDVVATALNALATDEHNDDVLHVMTEWNTNVERVKQQIIEKQTNTICP